MHLPPHYTYDNDDCQRLLATIHPASEQSMQLVLAADEHSDDGRSQWVWLRLPNGDLILGVFPQGETYLACEEDACYKG